MLKALIADDDINVGQCLMRLIPWDALGFEVAGVAYNGQEAFDMAVRLDPDVIISDIVMPVMDGTELCRKIRGSRSDVAFIFLSGYEDFTTAQLALRYRVEDYVLKPIDRNKINRLSELLRNIRLDLEQTSFYRALALDKGMESAIIGAVRSGDGAFFDRLFDRLHRDIDRMERSLGDVKEIGLRLLTLLYQQEGGHKPPRKAAFEALEDCAERWEAARAVAEVYRSAFLPSGAEKQSPHRQTVERVREYIDLHLSDENLSVSALAAAFHYSADHLNRLFAQYMGDTISQYLTNRRMQTAAELLKCPDLSVGHIARQVGYGNAGYFARGFRKKYGVTPGEYRQRGSDER